MDEDLRILADLFDSYGTGYWLSGMRAVGDMTYGTNLSGPGASRRMHEASLENINLQSALDVLLRGEKYTSDFKEEKAQFLKDRIRDQTPSYGEQHYQGLMALRNIVERALAGEMSPIATPEGVEASRIKGR